MLGQHLLTLFITMLLSPAPADTRLADAAMQGDRATVQALLARKVDANEAQGDGSTALHWAAYRNDVEMTRLLIQAGANIKATTRLGDYTPLFLAAKNGGAAVVELLLKAGSDVNSTNKTGTTPLMLAAASGRPDAVKVLLEHGADVNAVDTMNGQTALMFAAAVNGAPTVKQLTANHANLNLLSKVLQPHDPNDRKNGINPNRRMQQGPWLDSLTTLHFAAREGHIDAIRKLVAAET